MEFFILGAGIVFIGIGAVLFIRRKTPHFIPGMAVSVVLICLYAYFLPAILEVFKASSSPVMTLVISVLSILLLLAIIVFLNFGMSHLFRNLMTRPGTSVKKGVKSAPITPQSAESKQKPKKLTVSPATVKKGASVPLGAAPRSITIPKAEAKPKAPPKAPVHPVKPALTVAKSAVAKAIPEAEGDKAAPEPKAKPAALAGDMAGESNETAPAGGQGKALNEVHAEMVRRYSNKWKAEEERIYEEIDRRRRELQDAKRDGDAIEALNALTDAEKKLREEALNKVESASKETTQVFKEELERIEREMSDEADKLKRELEEEGKRSAGEISALEGELEQAEERLKQEMIKTEIELKSAMGKAQDEAALCEEAAREALRRFEMEVENKRRALEQAREDSNKRINELEADIKEINALIDKEESSRASGEEAKAQDGRDNGRPEGDGAEDAEAAKKTVYETKFLKQTTVVPEKDPAYKASKKEKRRKGLFGRKNDFAQFEQDEEADEAEDKPAVDLKERLKNATARAEEETKAELSEYEPPENGEADIKKAFEYKANGEYERAAAEFGACFEAAVDEKVKKQIDMQLMDTLIRAGQSQKALERANYIISGKYELSEAERARVNQTIKVLVNQI